ERPEIPPLLDDAIPDATVGWYHPPTATNPLHAGVGTIPTTSRSTIHGVGEGYGGRVPVPTRNGCWSRPTGNGASEIWCRGSTHGRTEHDPRDYCLRPDD